LKRKSDEISTFTKVRENDENRDVMLLKAVVREESC